MFKDNINKMFNSIKATNKNKEDIYIKIKEIEDEENIDKKRYRDNTIYRFNPVLIFILIIIFSATVFAFSSNYQNFSNKILDWSESEDATKLDISARDKGYIVRAESIYGDKKNSYLVLSVEREDGKKIKTMEKNGKTNININTKDEYIIKDGVRNILEGSSYYSLISPYKDSNKEYFLIKHIVDIDDKEGINMIDSKLYLNINSINTGFLGFPKKGNWEIEIPLNYKDISNEYIIDQSFIYKGKEAILHKIQLSPLDIILYFKSDSAALEDATLKVFDNSEYIKIKSGDGNIIPTDTIRSGGSNNGNNFYIHLSTIETGPLQSKDIEYIILGDSIIEIDIK